MGLLDYYRQFSGMSDEEVGQIFRSRSTERRQQALAKIEALDLSRTTWHEFPHPDVVAAVTFAARGALNRTPDPHAVQLRADIARRSGLEPTRVVAGHGAAQLLADAALALLEPGDELLTPWPSYSLYPRMARRAGARAVPVAGGFDPAQLLAAVTDHTRVIAICNPNDPTGEYMTAAALEELLSALPERVWVLVDEALGHFVEAEEPNAALPLLEDHPRLLVFRTLSKAYGLAGLRCGWALGGDGSEEVLERLEPELGLSTPVQAGALTALAECEPLLARRRAVVTTERARLLDALSGSDVDVAPSQANFLWLRRPGVPGRELMEQLRRGAVTAWAGVEIGDDEHVRVAVQSAAASDRLLEALAGD
jgi:histidinol-phosphate aminotransferase